mmetsp:Transcript_48951/g.114532  ORF Transcript_48951/g.114532 Transcript_48951/m.114532 type:complete len:204 (-) Transcript_48951:332-943(-)
MAMIVTLQVRRQQHRRLTRKQRKPPQEKGARADHGNDSVAMRSATGMVGEVQRQRLQICLRVPQGVVHPRRVPIPLVQPFLTFILTHTSNSFQHHMSGPLFHTTCGLRRQVLATLSHHIQDTDLHIHSRRMPCIPYLLSTHGMGGCLSRPTQGRHRGRAVHRRLQANHTMHLEVDRRSGTEILHWSGMRVAAHPLWLRDFPCP